jgi:hypothetical protein
MTGVVTAAPHNSMIDLFARRSKVATRAIGLTDVLPLESGCCFATSRVRSKKRVLVPAASP